MALQEFLQLEKHASFGLKSVEDVELSDEIEELNSEKLTRLPITPFTMNKNVQLRDSNTGRHIHINMEKGTTTLGFKYQGGVVIAVDSRATGGDFIFSGSVKKIIEINKYLLGTMAGGAADCSYWHRSLTVRCRMYELRNKERISVAAASKLLANILYNYKGMGLSMGTMIIGWDKRGPGLYYVDDSGSRYSGDLFSAGSGSPFALGVVDTHWKYDMTDEEAYELGRRAIYQATYRDGASGGIVRVYGMKPTGWVKISEQDCKVLHYKYADEKMV